MYVFIIEIITLEKCFILNFLCILTFIAKKISFIRYSLETAIIFRKENQLIISSKRLQRI